MWRSSFARICSNRDRSFEPVPATGSDNASPGQDLDWAIGAGDIQLKRPLRSIQSCRGELDGHIVINVNAFFTRPGIAIPLEIDFLGIEE
ncbi:MAG: hypothetical protein LAO55_25955 [Acidobacteriia bacterium]|nr:hypothetical protein [Terriglobia bacterium]